MDHYHCCVQSLIVFKRVALTTLGGWWYFSIVYSRIEGTIQLEQTDTDQQHEDRIHA